MQHKHAGKTAVVLGGSRGIGAAVATRLAAEGAHVVIGYLNNDLAAKKVVSTITAAGGSASAERADVADPGQIIALMDNTAEHGKIDILVSCAGIERWRPLDEIHPLDFDEVMHINVRGQLLATQAAVRHMPSGGRVVLTSSVSASRSRHHHCLYAASKKAIEAIVENLAPELGDRGITINALAPGGVATDMASENARYYQHPASTESMDIWLKTHNALGRLADPEEMAGTVSFLVSEDSSYITGSVVRADGGFF